jgi:hypothetical protein
MASASSPATAGGQAAPLGVAASATDALLDKLPEDPLKQKIAKLKEEQETLRKARKEVRKQMKNTKRQQTRLRHRARLMTDEDLVAVLLMRKSRKAAAEGGKRGASQNTGEKRGAAGREDCVSEEEAERRMEETGDQVAPLADGDASDRET